jgi:hypothetical protein
MDLPTNESTQRQQAYAKKIEQQATQHRSVRNPESTLQDRLIVEQETDCYGKYKATHSFKRNGQVFHRNYSFTPQELEQFRQQNPSLATQFRAPDGFNPERHSSPQSSVFQPDPGATNFSHLEYSNTNLPTPVSSFQQSFNEKHGDLQTKQQLPQRAFDMNVLQNTNISGNLFEPVRSGPVAGSFPPSNTPPVNHTQHQSIQNVPGSFNPMQNNYALPMAMNVQSNYQPNNQSMSHIQNIQNCQNGM